MITQLKFPIQKYRYAIIIMLLCTYTSSFAQKLDPFDGKSASFHVQFTRYFNSPEAEKSSRLLLLDSVHTYQLDTAWNLSNLRSQLDHYENLLVSLERHNEYFRLKCYVENKDTLSKKIYTQLDDAIGSLQGMAGRLLVNPAFTKLGAARLSQYNLLQYQYLLTQASQEAAHNLSDHDEALISTLSNAMIDHLTDRYDLLMDQIKADSIQSACCEDGA